MLGVLLESRAKRQRRAGGAALSVAVHVAIIGAVIVRTVNGTPAPKGPDKSQVFQIVPPAPAAKPVVAQLIRHNVPSVPTNMIVHRIEVPTVMPPSLPPIDMKYAGAADTIILGGGPEYRGAGRGRGTSIIDNEPASGGSEWRGSEVLMHILTPAKPRYPESLRTAGVDGRVMVQFTVDTTGRIDMKSVKVLSSTHELFARAVRDALSGFRFRPAEVGGKHVAALAEMPFEFQISR